MKQRIISKEEIGKMLEEIQKASMSGVETWEPVWEKYINQKALIEFPLGEFMNTTIQGYIAGWNLYKKIQTKPITEKDKFNAQGLEGKASVPVNLFTALLVWRELPEYRRQIVEIENTGEHIEA